MPETPEHPWYCHDCGERQTKAYDMHGKEYWNTNGWMHVRLAPAAAPVMLHLGCFEGYARDWPLYDGTREGDKDPWGFEDGLWVLRADYWDRLRSADCSTCHHPAVEHTGRQGTLMRCDHCTCAVVMATGSRRTFLFREGEKNRG